MLSRQGNSELALKPNEGSMLKAMDWAVPGLGGGALTTVGVPPPPPPPPPVDEDEEGAEDGDGRVASFGVPTTLSVLAAASTPSARHPAARGATHLRRTTLREAEGRPKHSGRKGWAANPGIVPRRSQFGNA